MKPVSLSRRFFTSTAIVVAVVMTVSLLIIDYRYVQELEKSEQERLRLHIYTLLSVAQLDKGEIHLPSILYNQRFNSIGSGLWAAVLDENRGARWHSLSIDKPATEVMLADKTGQWVFGKHQSEDGEYLTAAYYIAWEDTNRYTFHFVVGEDSSVIDKEIRRFRLLLLSGFFLITITMLLGQYIVLKLAFRPITLLEKEIAAMEEGVSSKLSPDYPKELSGVTQNLNALVEKEYQMRERYRAAMADLAHSLKTPLAIITNELNAYPQNNTMQNALNRIDSSIEYQLRRAVVSGHTVLSKGTQLNQVLTLVKEAMENIYRERSVRLAINVSDSLLFYGDENDLMEIFGNLLDNAFKYAHRRIVVSAEQIESGLAITVEDDGPGFSEEDGWRIFSRGERLDRQALGQGIGLAVVYDIVKYYKGEIEASQSVLGGARFHIVFPNRGSNT